MRVHMIARRVAQFCPVLALGLCTMTAPSPDAGCRTYGEQRRDMPTLGLDDVSRWVAVTDNAMTGACRG